MERQSPEVSDFPSLCEHCVSAQSGVGLGGCPPGAPLFIFIPFYLVLSHEDCLLYKYKPRRTINQRPERCVEIRLTNLQKLEWYLEYVTPKCVPPQGWDETFFFHGFYRPTRALTLFVQMGSRSTFWGWGFHERAMSRSTQIQEQRREKDQMGRNWLLQSAEVAASPTGSKWEQWGWGVL